MTFIHNCSVIDELNTKQDVEHLASHYFSLQGEGVSSLQSQVHCPPTSGAKLAKWIAIITVVGVVSYLLQTGSILVKVDPGLLTYVISGLITECYQVDPSTGGGEHSLNKGKY